MQNCRNCNLDSENLLITLKMVFSLLLTCNISLLVKKIPLHLTSSKLELTNFVFSSTGEEKKIYKWHPIIIIKPFIFVKIFRFQNLSQFLSSLKHTNKTFGSPLLLVHLTGCYYLITFVAS